MLSRIVFPLSAFFVLIVIGIGTCNSKNTKSGKNFTVLVKEILPYAIKIKETRGSNKLAYKGPVFTLFKKVAKSCYTDGDELEIKKSSDIKRNEEQLAIDAVLPVMKEWQDLLEAKDGLFDNEYMYIPVMESPGVVILVTDDDTFRCIAIEVLIKCWPLGLVVISSASLAGVIMWILDHRKNYKDFPQRFLHGGWEGIWWAFVTMTTVGYGDRSPRSIQGRVCGLLWMFVGIVLMSIFTATLTTAFTTDQTEIAEIKESKIGVLSGSREEILAIKERAFVEGHKNVRTLLKKLQAGQIDGILVDSLYAHYLGTRVGHLKEAAYIRSSAFFGIVLQNQTVEMQHCFAREVFKRKSWLYQFMSNKHEKKSRRKNYRRKVEETTNVVFNGLVTVFILCTVVTVVLVICCIVWQAIQQRLVHKKRSSVEDVGQKRIASVAETSSATFNPITVTKQ